MLKVFKFLSVATLIFFAATLDNCTPNAPPPESALVIPLDTPEQKTVVITETDKRDFKNFIDSVKTEGANLGLKPATLANLDKLEPNARVLVLDKAQPESTTSFKKYSSGIVSAARIKQGHKIASDNKANLTKIEETYGVPAHYLLALLAVESNFGQSMGNFSVLQSLASLGWEGRRAAFFRKELLNALTIIDKGMIRSDKLTGSWAGAMGQCQFMPSTFLQYAQDFDKDGKIDIWNNQNDSLASAANYLSKIGWKKSEPWGESVTLPASFPTELVGLTIKKTNAEWSQLGIMNEKGKPLNSNLNLVSSLIMVENKPDQAYLVYNNFRLIMQWNKSTFFATSVGLLADQIAKR